MLRIATMTEGLLTRVF